MILGFPPGTWPAVFEPEHHRGRVGRQMLAIGHAHGLPLILEDFLGFEAVADGLVKQCALDPVVSRRFAELQGSLERRVLGLPVRDCLDRYVEEVGKLAVRSAKLAELPHLLGKSCVIFELII